MYTFTVPLDNWRERCHHSVLLRVLNIIYSLFGIGTSASRDHRCPIIPFLFLCAAVSLSRFPIKKKPKTKQEKHTLEKKKKKKKKMIATILEPGNQVIDWSSRKLDSYSRQGFSFLLHESPNLLHLLSTFPRCLTAGDSCYLRCFPAAMPYGEGERKKKTTKKQKTEKPWHSKNVKRTNLLKFSPGKRKKKNT